MGHSAKLVIKIEFECDTYFEHRCIRFAFSLAMSLSEHMICKKIIKWFSKRFVYSAKD